MRDESELQTQVNCDLEAYLEAYLENAASHINKYQSPAREAEEHLTSC